MPFIPLDIPAGFYRNGTDLEQSGRWRDGSLRPVKGWLERKANNDYQTDMNIYTKSFSGFSFSLSDASSNIYLDRANNSFIVVR